MTDDSFDLEESNVTFLYPTNSEDSTVILDSKNYKHCPPYACLFFLIEWYEEYKASQLLVILLNFRQNLRKIFLWVFLMMLRLKFSVLSFDISRTIKDLSVVKFLYWFLRNFWIDNVMLLMDYTVQQSISQSLPLQHAKMTLIGSFWASCLSVLLVRLLYGRQYLIYIAELGNFCILWIQSG